MSLATAGGASDGLLKAFGYSSKLFYILGQVVALLISGVKTPNTPFQPKQEAINNISPVGTLIQDSKQTSAGFCVYIDFFVTKFSSTNKG